MMDKIIITDLELFGRHGVYPEEQVLGQKFLVSAELFMDTRKAGKTDCLEESVNYGTVCHEIKTFLEEHTYHLIEAAAEHTAEYLLLQFPLLSQVTLELKKPWAPIGLSVESVSVKIARKWHTVYAALGSNMGDREAYLAGAVNALRDTEGIRVETVSDFLMTAPYGVTDQDPFLNGCMKLQTLLTLDGLTVRQPEGYKDSLGEFDYTQGSGWMCAVNGYYPGRGLSNVFLGDGDVVTIAFTLAYGKDIGGADAANVRGNLRTYCGTWLGDRYIPHHDFVEGKCSICGKAEEAHEHQWTEEVTREATCTDSGEKTLTCGECGETKTESIPALGHDYRSGGVVWEQEGESCTAEFTCTRCGSSGTIHASRADGTLMENGRVEATCGQDGYVSYLAVGSIGGTQVRCEGTVTLPATGEHTYNEDGVCSVCGRKKDEETAE